MNDQFQHVMVLTSIIIGLGITQLLSAVGDAIDRVSTSGNGFRLGRIHGWWVGFMFVWLVAFWWWQFRLLGIVTTWTLGRYLFIILYAVVLFLLGVILIPRAWDSVTDLDEYFMAKRHWFFSLFLLANIADVADSYLKGGWSYIAGTGPMAIGGAIATIPVFIIGMRSTNMRVQGALAIVMFIWQIMVSFNAFPLLGL